MTQPHPIRNRSVTPGSRSPRAPRRPPPAPAAPTPRLVVLVVLVLRLAGLPIAVPAASAAQASDAAPAVLPPVEYSIRRWHGPGGPAPRSVEAILQTRDGYLWFGMNEGLFRFDGLAFQILEPQGPSTGSATYVTALAQDAEGTLWAGSAGNGLLRLQDGLLVRVGADQGLTNGQIRALHLTTDGRLWIGTDGGGVFVRDPDGQFRNFGADQGLPEPFVLGLSEDHRGRLYAVTFQRGPFVLEDGRFTAVPLEPAIELGTGFSLTRSPSGTVWLGTPEGVYRLEDDRFRRWKTADQLPGHNPVVAWEQDNGETWLGTAQGIALWRDPTWTPYPIGGGSAARFAGAFAIDREGNLWTGTEGAGLVQLRRTKFATLGSPEGLAGDEITSVLQGRDGALWIGTPRGLSCLEGGRISTFTRKDGLPDDFIFSLHEDAAGVLWVSTRLGGLARRHANGFAPLPAEDALPARAAWCLAGTRDGAVWVGTPRGAFEYRAGRLATRLDHQAGLSNEDVRTIAEDHDGTLWLGTSFGLCAWRDGRMTTHTELPSGDQLEVVISLYVDPARDLWIGTMTRGLFRHRDGVFTRYTTEQGLASSTITAITEDARGHLWLSSSRGIMRIPKASLQAVADGTASRLEVTAFDRASGIRSDECSGTLQPTVARDRDGRLWFATTGGLSTTHPDRIPVNTVAPLVHIERVAIEGPEPVLSLTARTRGGTPRTLERTSEPGDIPAPAAPQRAVFNTPQLQAVTLPPGQERIEFQYVGLSHLMPESVVFRYRLDGFDHRWVDAGSRRVAYYTRVPPGRYTFRVLATQEDGITSAPAQLAVFVQPTWWQTPWLRPLVALLSAGTIAALILARLRRLQVERAASAELSRELIRSQERERLRLAAELHDGLAQELQVIRNRAELALDRQKPEPPLARELQAISDTAARAILGVRAMSNGLRPPELDQLGLTQALIWLGETVRDGLRGRLDARVEPVDGLLPRELELHVYRVVQEALNNAVKHSNAAEITLEVERDGDGLRLSVFDNGRGFNVDTLTFDPRAGSGLRTMHERAAMLRGTLELRSAPGVGTRLTLVVPGGHTQRPTA